MEHTDESAYRCNCKIGRNADTYDVASLHEDVIQQRQEDGASLRDLEQWINIQLVKAALDRSDVPVAGDAESIYHALTSEEIATQRRVEMTDRLINHDVDVDQLRKDFVSYQTVRNHLRECLNISTERRGVESVAEGMEVIEWAIAHCTDVVERMLLRMGRRELLGIGNLDVTVSVTATCSECDTISDIRSFVEEGGCECTR